MTTIFLDGIYTQTIYIHANDYTYEEIEANMIELERRGYIPKLKRYGYDLWLIAFFDRGDSHG